MRLRPRAISSIAAHLLYRKPRDYVDISSAALALYFENKSSAIIAMSWSMRWEGLIAGDISMQNEIDDNVMIYISFWRKMKASAFHSIYRVKYLHSSSRWMACQTAIIYEEKWHFITSTTYLWRPWFACLVSRGSGLVICWPQFHHTIGRIMLRHRLFQEARLGFIRPSVGRWTRIDKHAPRGASRDASLLGGLRLDLLPVTKSFHRENDAFWPVLSGAHIWRGIKILASRRDCEAFRNSTVIISSTTHWLPRQTLGHHISSKMFIACFAIT